MDVWSMFICAAGLFVGLVAGIFLMSILFAGREYDRSAGDE